MPCAADLRARVLVGLRATRALPFRGISKDDRAGSSYCPPLPSSLRATRERASARRGGRSHLPLRGSPGFTPGSLFGSPNANARTPARRRWYVPPRALSSYRKWPSRVAATIPCGSRRRAVTAPDRGAIGGSVARTDHDWHLPRAARREVLRAACVAWLRSLGHPRRTRCLHPHRCPTKRPSSGR